MYLGQDHAFIHFLFDNKLYSAISNRWLSRTPLLILVASLVLIFVGSTEFLVSRGDPGYGDIPSSEDILSRCLGDTVEINSCWPI